jgi:hypothetical protein
MARPYRKRRAGGRPGHVDPVRPPTALDIVYSAVPLRDGAGEIIGGLEVVVDQTAVPLPRDRRGS